MKVCYSQRTRLHPNNEEFKKRREEEEKRPNLPPLLLYPLYKSIFGPLCERQQQQHPTIESRLSRVERGVGVCVGVCVCELVKALLLYFKPSASCVAGPVDHKVIFPPFVVFPFSSYLPPHQQASKQAPSWLERLQTLPHEHGYHIVTQDREIHSHNPPSPPGVFTFSTLRISNFFQIFS